MLENFNPVYDATVVEKLKAVDYINVGKTNLDEFAMGSSTEIQHSLRLITQDLTRFLVVLGGSAAAVVAGDVYALGTDTGGSIRICSLTVSLMKPHTVVYRGGDHCLVQVLTKSAG